MCILTGLYHSSKAAVTILSETLRLELAPLGVTVVTGMIGVVASNFASNDTWPGLKEGSLYKCIELEIGRHVTSYTTMGENTKVFASHFIDDIFLKGASGQVWRGSEARIARFMGYHAPMSVLVSNPINHLNLIVWCLFEP